MEITQLQAHATRENGWRVRLSIETESRGGVFQGFTDIHGKREDLLISAKEGRSTAFHEIMVEDPALWYPAGYGRPNLYPLSVNIDGCQRNMHIGFAEIRKDGRSLYANGIRIHIKAARMVPGVSYSRMIRDAAMCSLNLLVSEEDLPEEAYAEADSFGVMIAAPAKNGHPSSLSLQELPDIEFGEDSEEPLFFKTPSSRENAAYLSSLGRALKAESRILSLRTRMEPLTVSLADDSISVMKYFARMFLSPLAPVMMIENEELLVYIANDTDRSEKGELSVKIRDYAGNKKFTKEYEFTAEPSSCALLDRIQLGRVMRSECFCNAKLATKDLLRERTMLLDTPRRSRLLPPELSASVSRMDRSMNIKLNVRNPAFYVTLSSPVPGVFSDNVISVRPSAEKNIIFTPEGDFDPEDFSRTLRIYDLASAAI